jgi:hypothetical protein
MACSGTALLFTKAKNKPACSRNDDRRWPTKKISSSQQQINDQKQIKHKNTQETRNKKEQN